MEVNNQDIVGLVAKIRRYRYSAVKAVSSGLSSVSNADGVRLTDNLDNLEKKVEFVYSRPEADFPESSPAFYELGDAETLPIPDNEFLADIMRYYETMEKEIVNSQSARKSTGLVIFDYERIIDTIKRMRNLAAYAAEALPEDLPEAYPLRASTGAGRTGI